MKSSFVQISNGLIHFLSCGEGPPIFLFHASPMSSQSLVPLMQELSASHTVIAPDTPGYGLSERPVSQPSHIRAYAELIHELKEQLGLDKIAIYGTATGAQLGIRYAIEYPDDVSILFLDNAAHFSDADTALFLEDYFPDFTPQIDGSHLSSIWDNVIHLFEYFPWCIQEEKYKLSSPPLPIHVLHKIFIDYLKCGPQYDWAYKVAFEHEKRENIFKVQCPVHIFRWDLSIIKPYTDQIFEIPPPENISQERITAADNRYQFIAQSIAEKINQGDSTINWESTMATAPESTNIKIPENLPVFQTPGISGQYLMRSWEMLDKYLEKEATIDYKNMVFLKWAENVTQQV